MRYVVPVYPNAGKGRARSPAPEVDLFSRSSVSRPAPSGFATDAVPDKPPLRVLSYGGGLDSFAMLVDAIQRGELPDLVIFADVADRKHEDPGEWPGTYQHIREVAMPLCARYGIEFKWLHTDEYNIRGERSLIAYFEKTSSMPGRVSRLCTSAAKVERITEYLADHYPAGKLEIWIGFEAGEEKRAEKDPHSLAAQAKGGGQRKTRSGRTGKARLAGRRTNRFPLIEQRICRCRAAALVRKAGFPVPPKSACTYCPFGTKGDFQRLRTERPQDFERLVQLEKKAKKTKSGATIRFGGDRSLEDWTARAYKPRAIPCEVCGAAVREAKFISCGHEEGEDHFTDEDGDE